MGVLFVIGRAGVGKTHYCLQALLRAQEKGEEQAPRPLTLLVPEQTTLQMERVVALGTPMGGFWRPEVLSFSRLARRMADRYGGPIELTRMGRSMGLRHVVSRRPELLAPFGRGALSRGFHQQLQTIIDELLRGGVTAVSLRGAAGGVEDARARTRIAALSEILADYVGWLGPQRVDPAQALAALRERLRELDGYAGASVWVDGFAGFTAEELETLVAMAQQARQVTITLLLDDAPAGPFPEGPDLFRRSRATLRLLKGRFIEAGVATETLRLAPAHTPPRFRAAALGRLEAGLASWPADPPPATVTQQTAVQVIRCPTHRAELECAAAWIHRRIADSAGRLRFRDFALVTRDLAPFADDVARAFERYDLPYFLDRRRSLAQHALTRLVDALFDACATDFSAAAMIRILQSGLTPLSRTQAETLENHVLRNELRGAETWRKATWSPQSDTRDEAGQACAVRDQRRRRLLAALEPLLALHQQGSQPIAASLWATALERAVDGIAARRRLSRWIREEQLASDWESAELHRLAWEAFSEVIHEVVTSLGDTPLSAREARDVFSDALKTVTMGLAPPTLDQVMVGSIERSRHPEVKFVWLFAFNEGVFPARPDNDALLTSRERSALLSAGLSAFRSRDDDLLDERMLAYVAMTRPSEGLMISYAAADASGASAFPSPLLDRVRMIFPTSLTTPELLNPQPGHVVELPAAYFSAQRHGPQRSERRRIEALIRAVSMGTSRGLELTRLLRGRDDHNRPAPIGDWRLERAGLKRVWRLSPSELESYLQCPFRHFARYGLRLQPRRGPTPIRWELGQLAHELLAAVTRRVIEAQRLASSVSDEEWSAWLRSELDALRARRGEHATASTPRRGFLVECLGALLLETLLAHAARWRAGSLQPIAAEQSFGDPRDAQSWPVLQLEVGEDVEAHLQGRIDRIDAGQVEGESLLLIYDYKSSVRWRPRAKFLTLDALPLLLYLLAASRAAKDQAGGVLLAPLYSRTADLDALRDAARAEARMSLFLPRGIFQERLARALDRDLERRGGPSVVARMRWTKSRRLGQADDARPAASVKERLAAAEAAVRAATAGVASGRVDVAPLLDRNCLACASCDLRPLCRFQLELNRPETAEQRLPLLASAAQTEEAGADEPD